MRKADLIVGRDIVFKYQIETKNFISVSVAKGDFLLQITPQILKYYAQGHETEKPLNCSSQ